MTKTKTLVENDGVAPTETTTKNLLEQLREDAGAGQEFIGREDVALPFIKLLQSTSPEIQKRDPKFIENAESGMFFNTVTEELFDGEKGMTIIPCLYEKTFIEWIPRERGGGFVAEHRTREDAIANADPKNDVNDTANHYVLVKTEDGRWQQALFPMTSTKLGASRRLNALCLMKTVEDPDSDERFTPPNFGYQYLVTSIETENDKGRFFIPKVSDTGPVENMAIYQEARKFYRLCKEGAVRVDFNKFEDQEEFTAESADDVDF